MSQIAVDTDVASCIFNWHSSAQRYGDALRGSELILSFMSIAEKRMGAIAGALGCSAARPAGAVHLRFRCRIC